MVLKANTRHHDADSLRGPTLLRRTRPVHPDTCDRRASNGSAMERERTRVTLQSTRGSSGAMADDTVASMTAR